MWTQAQTVLICANGAGYEGRRRNVWWIIAKDFEKTPANNCHQDLMVGKITPLKVANTLARLEGSI
jgi:hypothetical protein